MGSRLLIFPKGPHSKEHLDRKTFSEWHLKSLCSLSHAVEADTH